MSEPPFERRSVDPERHPAALSSAIAHAWRRYRWRAYAVAVPAGMLAGGVFAPMVTTSVQLALAVAGAAAPERVPWWEGVWLVAFALTVPVTGATVFARWQPRALRMAAQTYIWLVVRAEENWARVFGDRPVPRDERRMRGVLASCAGTPDTAGERFGLWLGLLECDRARAAASEMPEATAHDRYRRAAALWLADFVAGTTRPLETLQPLVDALDDPDGQVEAAVEMAVNRARVALAEGHDWQAPLAAVRNRLGASPERPYYRALWQPTFRRLLISTCVGVAVFWLAVIALEPYFPAVARFHAR